MLASIFAHFTLGLLLTSPWLWGLVALLVVAAGFYLAPTQTLAVLTNVRTWVIVGFVTAGVLFAHQQATIKADAIQITALSNDNKSLHTEVQTQAGAMQALTTLVNSKAANAKQVGKLHQIVVNAPQGTKEDAVLDQLAADQATPAPAPAPGGGGGSATDRLLDGLGAAPRS